MYCVLRINSFLGVKKTSRKKDSKAHKGIVFNAQTLQGRADIC